MSYLFLESDFNSDLSKWDVSSVEDMRGMFTDSPLRGKEFEWYKR